VIVGIGRPATTDQGDASNSLYSLAATFRDDTGREVKLSSFRGKPVVLAMFYSECTSRCPMTLERLRAIDEAFAARKEAVDIVLVSFDVRRETTKTLARFRKRERLPKERWHLLRGSEEATQSLARAVGFGNVLDLGDHFVHPVRIVKMDAEGTITKTLDLEHRDVAAFVE